MGQLEDDRCGCTRAARSLSLPVFLPEDTAIPIEEVPAEAQFTRDFVRDKENLQREQKSDVSRRC